MPAVQYFRRVVELRQGVRLTCAYKPRVSRGAIDNGPSPRIYASAKARFSGGEFVEKMVVHKFFSVVGAGAIVISVSAEA